MHFPKNWLYSPALSRRLRRKRGARASGRPRSEDDMIELKDDSAAVLNREFFAEAGDALPADLADYDAPDKGAGEYASILSDGEGGVAPAS